MILPNKVLKFEDSIMGKLTYILDVLKKEDMLIGDLYQELSDEFDDVNSFMLALDVLFVLNAVVLDKGSGVLKYVNRT